MTLDEFKALMESRGLEPGKTYKVDCSYKEVVAMGKSRRIAENGIVSEEALSDKPTFSPGSWRWIRRFDESDRQDELTSAEDGDVLRVYWDDGDGHMVVSDANARLIAAAPEMYDAILDALISLDPNEETEWAKHARVLLARISPQKPPPNRCEECGATFDSSYDAIKHVEYTGHTVRAQGKMAGRWRMTMGSADGSGEVK